MTLLGAVAPLGSLSTPCVWMNGFEVESLLQFLRIPQHAFLPIQAPSLLRFPDRTCLKNYPKMYLTGIHRICESRREKLSKNSDMRLLRVFGLYVSISSSFSGATSPAIPIHGASEIYRPRLRSASSASAVHLSDSPRHIQKMTTIRTAVGLLSSLIAELEAIAPGTTITDRLTGNGGHVNHEGFVQLVKTNFDGILDSLINEPTLHLDVAETERSIISVLELPHSARKYNGIPIGRIIQQLKGLKSDLSSHLGVHVVADESGEESGEEDRATSASSSDDLPFEMDPLV